MGGGGRGDRNGRWGGGGGGGVRMKIVLQSEVSLARAARGDGGTSAIWERGVGGGVGTDSI